MESICKRAFFRGTDDMVIFGKVICREYTWKILQCTQNMHAQVQFDIISDDVLSSDVCFLFYWSGFCCCTVLLFLQIPIQGCRFVPEKHLRKQATTDGT